MRNAPNKNSRDPIPWLVSSPGLSFPFLLFKLCFPNVQSDWEWLTTRLACVHMVLIWTSLSCQSKECQCSIPFLTFLFCPEPDTNGVCFNSQYNNVRCSLRLCQAYMQLKLKCCANWSNTEPNKYSLQSPRFRFPWLRLPAWQPYEQSWVLELQSRSTWKKHAQNDGFVSALLHLMTSLLIVLWETLLNTLALALHRLRSVVLFGFCPV